MSTSNRVNLQFTQGVMIMYCILRKKMKKEKREQEGIMHVYFRANGRYTVFYDDEDNLELLRRMNKFAGVYDSKIMDFALMINHAHFLLRTECVTTLMREVLKNYSRWYNRKYKNSNKVFHTPFSSACKRSEEWVLESCAYIMQNPVKARLCARAEEYRWSSAVLHFPGRNCRDKKEKRISEVLGGAIDVDTSLVDSYFESYEEFLEYANLNPVMKSSVVGKDDKWERSTVENLYAELKDILDGRILNNLSKDEIKDVVVQLYSRTHTRMLYIASLLHIDYKYVRKLLADKYKTAE